MRRVYGPLDGSIDHDPNDGRVDTHETSMTLVDGVFEARFFKPVFGAGGRLEQRLPCSAAAPPTSSTSSELEGPANGSTALEPETPTLRRGLADKALHPHHHRPVAQQPHSHHRPWPGGLVVHQ